MRRPSLLAQVVAVLSRRTPAFQPGPGQPRTFGGALHRVLRRRASTSSGGDSSDLRTRARVVRPGAVVLGGTVSTGVTIGGYGSPLDAVGQTDTAGKDVPRLDELVDEFAAQPAHERLAARAWLEHPAMELVSELLDLLGKTVAVRHALAHTHDLDHARALARDLARDLDLAIIRDLSVNLDRHDLDREDVHLLNLDLALNLARSLDRDLDRDGLDDDHSLDHARIRAPILHRALARALDGTVDRAPHDANLAAAIVSTVHYQLLALETRAEAEWDVVAEAFDRLRSAAENMVGADLRSADLAGIPLNGVRWSTSTRWPEALREWVELHSEQIGPDLYQVHDRHESTDRTPAPMG